MFPLTHGLLCNFNSPDCTVFAKHLSSDLSKSRQVFFGLWSQGSVTPRQTLQVQLKNAARPRNENKDQPHCQTMATRTLQLLYIYLETNRSRLGLIWSDLCQLGAIVLDKFLIILRPLCSYIYMTLKRLCLDRVCKLKKKNSNRELQTSQVSWTCSAISCMQISFWTCCNLL